MKFTAEKIASINERLWDKKRENRIDKNVIGIGINLVEGINGATASRNSGNCGWAICTVDDLARTIEELTMLKEAIEEETGLVL